MRSKWISTICIRPALALAALALVTTSCASSKKELSTSERAQLYVQAANGSLSEGDPTGALGYLLQAESADPKLPELHHTRALAFHAKNDPIAALQSARKAVSLNPTYSAANNTLGKLLLDQGNLKEAEKHLAAAANDSLYRDAYRPQTNLGILFYRQGEYSKSRLYLDRAVQSSPALACVAYYYRGHIHLKESRMQDAIKDYDRAVQKICAGFSDAHLALGIAFERSKQYDRARKKFVEIQQRYPDTPVAEKAIERLRYLP